MKLKYLYIISIVLFFSTTTQFANSQGVAINTSGAKADTSAILDISSTNQGILIPRMTAAQRAIIYAPQAGLLVYQTDGTPGFYFYNGTAWVAFAGSGPQGAAGNAPSGKGIVTVSNGVLQTTDSLKGDVKTFGSNLTTTIANNAVTTPKINDGAVKISKLGYTGTPTLSKYLRGDGSWVIPTATATQSVLFLMVKTGIYPSSGGGGGQSDFFIGQIIPFAGSSSSVPADMIECNGQLLNIQQNQALFSLLGTTYGGDGITTFALPNLNGTIGGNYGKTIIGQ